MAKSPTILALARGRSRVGLAVAICRRICALAGLLLLWGSDGVVSRAVAAETAEKSCSTLDECLRLVSMPGSCTSACGIAKDEQALAQRIWEIGAPAIPGLIDLLDHPDEQVRERVGYILREIDGLDASRLPVLMEARRRGNGWIPLAIARIGTTEAMRFLVDDLRRNPEIDSQVTWALASRSGEAIPYLLDGFSCTGDCDPDYFRAVGVVLREIGEPSTAAVPRLTAIAADNRSPLALRRGAIRVLGDIGRPAATAAPFLRGLLIGKDTTASEVSFQLSGEAAHALYRIGDAAAVPDLVETARYASGRELAFAVRRIASLGPNGISAGPFVRALLRNSDWDVRVEAAEALGWIGYGEAAPDLIEATRSADWRLVYQASWALGVLGAEEAIPRLAQIRESHWYPIVRTAASGALDAIQAGRVGTPDYDSEEAKRKRWDWLQGLSSQTANCRTGEVLWHDTWQEPARTSSGSTELKVETGTFIGTNNGEWGGELYFRDRAGWKTKIVDDNILGIFQTANGPVAVAGLAHMIINRGRVYALSASSPDDWQATTLLTLPGRPGALTMTADGDILMVGGSWAIVLRNGKDLEWLQCR